MFAPHISTQWKSFAARFVFPTAVTIALFVIAFFSIIIPAIEKSSMDRKREMIRELTNSAWNILAKLEHDEAAGPAHAAAGPNARPSSRLRTCTTARR